MHCLFLELKRSYEKESKCCRPYMCFADLEKAFDRIPRKIMEWALRKKGLAEVLVQAVMSLYEGSRTKVRVGSGASEEFEVRVGVHQRSVTSKVDVVTEHARDQSSKFIRGACVKLTSSDKMHKINVQNGTSRCASRVCAITTDICCSG